MLLLSEEWRSHRHLPPCAAAAEKVSFPLPPSPPSEISVFVFVFVSVREISVRERASAGGESARQFRFTRLGFLV
jgi:hypothetical protein